MVAPMRPQKQHFCVKALTASESKAVACGCGQNGLTVRFPLFMAGLIALNTPTGCSYTSDDQTAHAA